MEKDSNSGFKRAGGYWISPELFREGGENCPPQMFYKFRRFSNSIYVHLWNYDKEQLLLTQWRKTRIVDLREQGATESPLSYSEGGAWPPEIFRMTQNYVYTKFKDWVLKKSRNHEFHFSLGISRLFCDYFIPRYAWDEIITKQSRNPLGKVKFPDFYFSSLINP